MENVTPPPVQEKKHVLTVEDAEASISTGAIDFEDSSFVEENKFKSAGKDKVAPEENNDEKDGDAEAYEKQFIDNAGEKQEVDDHDSRENMEKIMQELADQPFEVAMSNLEVEKEDLLSAAEQVFSKSGFFEMDFNLPFGGTVTLRSKTINDYIDYTEYVRRLLLDPISKNEFNAVTEARHLAYAIVELDGDDYSQLDIEDKFKMVRDMSEIKLTTILNSTKSFWRVAHVLLHPGLSDFLLRTHEES